MTPIEMPADSPQVADLMDETDRLLSLSLLPLPDHGPSLLRASAAFTHAPGCLSTVSAPLCGCKHGTLEARLAESARMLAGDSNVVSLAAARAGRRG